MLAFGGWLLAAAAGFLEPSLLETLDAAARTAGGLVEEDASRTRRARAAHWAPQLRGQVLGRDDERDRVGEFRLAPVRDHATGTGRTWSLMLTWDFSQVVYAREESQIALAHAHLARVRREAQERAAELWAQRLTARAALASLPHVEACASLLRITAELDAVTGGLYRAVLGGEQWLCRPEDSR